jgi:hypothetical protein
MAGTFGGLSLEILAPSRPGGAVLATMAEKVADKEVLWKPGEAGQAVPVNAAPLTAAPLNAARGLVR